MPITEAITDWPSGIWSDARSDGGDIRFSSDEDGNTPLAREVVSFDNSGEKCEIWLLVPSYSYTANTTVYMWYGASSETEPAADSTYGSQAVYPSKYKGVWHLNESVNNDPGGYKDSTVNACHLSGTSMSMTAPDGVIGGKCAEFDGSEDYLYAGAVPVSALPFTFTCWFYPDNDTVNFAAGSLANASVSNQYYGIYPLGDVTGNPIRATHVNGGTASVEKTGYSASRWYHAAGIFGGTSQRNAALDGSLGTQNTNFITAVTGFNFTVGGRIRSDGLTLPLNGKIDEVRITDTQRPEEEIYFEWKSASAQSSASAGSVTTIGGGSNEGTGGLAAPVTTASGSGVVSYIAAGALTIAAALCSGSGSVTYSATTTTNQAAITANRSIGQDDYNHAGKRGYEAAFAKIALPDLAGETPTAAKFKVRLFSGYGPGTETDCTVYAKVCSTSWTDSSNISTMNALEAEFNLVSDLLDTVSVSESSGTEFEFDILGDSSHGILGAYTSDPTPDAITVMLRIPVIGSIVSDYVSTGVILGDEWTSGDPYRSFYPRSDSTYFPYIEIEHSSVGAEEGSGSIVCPSATVSGSGVVSHVGTGAITTPLPTVSGYEANVGEGSLVTPVPTVTGFGSVSVIADGALTIAPATASGLATVTYTGTGALVTPKVTAWGIYDKSDIVIPLPVVSGEGSVTNQNIGALTIPAATVSGTGSHSLVTTDPGTGAVTGLNRDIASYSWKSINAKGDVETRRAFQRLDMALQEIVTNVNNDLTNIVNGTTPAHVDLSDLEAAIAALQASVSTLQSDLNTAEATIEDHEVRIDALENEPGEIEAGISGTTRGVFIANNGAGGNTPGVLKLESRNGTYWYLFVEDDGTIRVHSALPANNNDGAVVGLQN